MTDSTTPAAGTAEAEILAQERRALDGWSQGRPTAYLEIDANDVTYFDDIGAHHRVEGKEALRAYMTALEGQIPPHSYEVVDPKVQLYGDMGVLTLHYHPSGPNGQPGQQWKATSVYRKAEGAWRIVHAHWSMIKTNA